MKRRNWGDVLAEVTDGDATVFVSARTAMSLRAADTLIEDLRSATAWIRDQQRPKVEDETPELPL
jgi:hypothetical protein